MWVGLILTVVGIVWLLQNLGLITGNAWQIIWPAVIIVLGLYILLKPKGAK